MSTKLSEKHPMKFENCITVERQKQRPNASACVAKRNEYEKGKVFQLIPIFRGYKMIERK